MVLVLRVVQTLFFHQFDLFGFRGNADGACCVSFGTRRKNEFQTLMRTAGHGPFLAILFSSMQETMESKQSSSSTRLRRRVVETQSLGPYCPQSAIVPQVFLAERIPGKSALPDCPRPKIRSRRDIVSSVVSMADPIRSDPTTPEKSRASGVMLGVTPGRTKQTNRAAHTLLYSDSFSALPI